MIELSSICLIISQWLSKHLKSCYDAIFFQFLTQFISRFIKIIVSPQNMCHTLSENILHTKTNEKSCITKTKNSNNTLNSISTMSHFPWDSLESDLIAHVINFAIWINFSCKLQHLIPFNCKEKTHTSRQGVIWETKKVDRVF